MSIIIIVNYSTYVNTSAKENHPIIQIWHIAVRAVFHGGFFSDFTFSPGGFAPGIPNISAVFLRLAMRFSAVRQRAKKRPETT